MTGISALPPASGRPGPCQLPPCKYNLSDLEQRVLGSGTFGKLSGTKVSEERERGQA